jgi:hypothetical protein
MPSSFGNIVAILLGLWIIRCVVLAIYRLTLHPLAKFPGPKIAAATRWYEFYYDVVPSRSTGGHYHHEVERMHEKYGK